MAILLIVMQVLMVTGRLVSRRLQKVMLGADDYALLSATVSLQSLAAFSLADMQIGFLSCAVWDITCM